MSKGRAFVVFTVDGTEVLRLSPAKLLEGFMYPDRFNHISGIVAFSVGQTISCHLKMPGYSLKTYETVSNELAIFPPSDSPEDITRDLMERLTKGTTS
jgi:hypothetical protein